MPPRKNASKKKVGTPMLSREHSPLNLTNVQYYENMLESESTITGLTKYLKKNLTREELTTFVNENHLTVTIGAEDPFRDVALEVWQQRRLAHGKDRFVFVS
jgi:hypothetical protein